MIEGQWELRLSALRLTLVVCKLRSPSRFTAQFLPHARCPRPHPLCAHGLTAAKREAKEWARKMLVRSLASLNHSDGKWKYILA